MDITNKRRADVGSDRYLILVTIRLKTAAIRQRCGQRRTRFNTRKLDPGRIFNQTEKLFWSLQTFMPSLPTTSNFPLANRFVIPGNLFFADLVWSSLVMCSLHMLLLSRHPFWSRCMLSDKSLLCSHCAPCPILLSMQLFWQFPFLP